MPRILPALLIPFLLSGCYTGWKLEELRQANPKGSPYQKELAALYLIFSESEAKNADWQASQYFASKGLHAAYGHDRLPELPEQWNIQGGTLAELQTARLSLIPLLTDDNKEQKPVDTAQAVFYYDCWVEEAEETWQPGGEQICRSGFHESLERLQPPAPPPVVEEQPLGMEDGQSASIQTTVSHAGEVPEIASTAYLLFFEHGDIRLNNEARDTLKQVATDLTRTEPDYTVIINGHADRSGGEQLNLEIALNRAESARAALMKLGVPQDKIQVFSFGEASPNVPTEDGTLESQNRRVEIFIAQ